MRFFRDIITRLAFVSGLAGGLMLVQPVSAQQDRTARSTTELAAVADSLWRTSRLESFPYYKELVQREPANPTFIYRLGILYSYRANYAQSLALLSRYRSLVPNDPEGIAALERVERHAAYDAPALEPSIMYTTDNEDNRSTFYSMRASRRFGSIRGGLFAAHRYATLPTSKGNSTYLTSSVYLERERDSWRIEVGGNARSGEISGITNKTTSLVAAGRYAIRPSERTVFGVSALLQPFDETALLIASGISVAESGVDASVTTKSNINISGIVTAGRISAGVFGARANQRYQGLLEAVKMYRPGWFFGGDVKVASYQYSTGVTYFAPKMLLLPEALIRYDYGRETGWGASGDWALGVQYLDYLGQSDSRMANRATAAIRFRPSLANEIALHGGVSNVASPSTVQVEQYRAYTIGLRGRIHF